MRSLIAGPVKLALLIAAIAAATPAPHASAAAQQPDPAPAGIQVDSVQVNLTEHPNFSFTVSGPAVLRFEAGTVQGIQYIHIWRYTRASAIATRISRTAAYMSAPAIGHIEALEFQRAVQRALRASNPERTLSYHRRLTLT